MNQHLLIELGTEELPSDALDVIQNDLAKQVSKIFQNKRIPFSSVKVETTPRRIALFLESVGERQQDQSLEFSGPSWDKAYDAEGKPTQALLGFVKSKRCELADVKIKETPKGKFVLAARIEKGKTVEKIIPGLIQELFTSMNFPKNMRWEPSGFRFPRPIRWLAVILGKKIVKVSLAGVESSNLSRGHRFLSPKPFRILAADWNAYQKLLKRNHVVLSQAEREAIIRKAMNLKFDQAHPDEDLIRLTTQLVEEPFLLKGAFSKSYLQLPSEVLASCMKKNQKIFACYDRNGRSDGRFIAVMNGRRAGLAKIRTDYENVLESRLRDAQYFYELDTKEPLENKLPLLEQLAYLGKLGTMRDKTQRLEKLAEHFGEVLKLNDTERKDLKRASHLCKIDLMTRMVYEFPELQGTMGRYYALESGESENVASAIGNQYLPKNLTEEYQNVTQYITKFDAILGIMHRLDYLVGAFGIGQAPTGSQDPYALRRSGGVFVKLIRAFKFNFSIEEAIQSAFSFFKVTLDSSPVENKQKLINTFLKERIAFELQLAAGSREMEIFQAVWNAAWKSSKLDIADVFDRFRILSGMCLDDSDIFFKAAKVVERTSNILKGVQRSEYSLKAELFTEPEERELSRILREKSPSVLKAIEGKDYGQATRLFADIFYQPIHDFFTKVMVNVEDENIRANRQALMKEIHALYATRVADLSLLSRMDQG